MSEKSMVVQKVMNQQPQQLLWRTVWSVLIPLKKSIMMQFFLQSFRAGLFC